MSDWTPPAKDLAEPTSKGWEPPKKDLDTPEPPPFPSAPPADMASPSSSVAGDGNAISSETGLDLDEFGDAIATPRNLERARRAEGYELAGGGAPPQEDVPPVRKDPYERQQQLLAANTAPERKVFLDAQATGENPMAKVVADYDTAAERRLASGAQETILDEFGDAIMPADDLKKSELGYNRDFAALQFQSEMLEARANQLMGMRDSVDPNDPAAVYAFEQEQKDIMAGQEFIRSGITQLAAQYPEYGAYLADLKSLEQAAQKEKEDFPITGAIKSTVTAPIVRTVNEMGTNLFRLASKFNGDTDGFLDGLATEMERNAERYRASTTPTSMKGSIIETVEGEDGSKKSTVHLDRLLAGSSEAIAQAAMLYASGGATAGASAGAQRALMSGQMFVQSYPEYYDAAKRAGLSDEEAMATALTNSSMQMASEAIFPEKYFPGGVGRSYRNAAVKAIEGGSTAFEAVKEMTKGIGREGMKNMGEEVAAYLGEKGVNHVTNVLTGSNLDDDVKASELIEAGGLGAIAGSFLTGVGQIRANPIRTASIDWALANEDAFMASIDKDQSMSPEAKKQVKEKLAAIKSVRAGVPGVEEMSPDDRAKVTDAVIGKREAEKAPVVVDEAITAVMGDPVEARIAAYNKVIEDVIGKPPPEKKADGTIKEPDPISPAQKALNKKAEKEIIHDSKAPPVSVPAPAAEVQAEAAAQPDIATGGVAEASVQASPAVPPVTVKQPVTDGPERVKKTIATKRAYEGDFSKEVKSEIERLGLYRDVENQQEAEASALEFIGSVGLDEALGAVRRNDVKGGAGAIIYAEAIKDVQGRMEGVTDAGELTSLAEEEADLLNELSGEGLSKGQFNAMMDYIYRTSDLGFNSAAMAQKWKAEHGVPVPPEMLEAWRKRDEEFKEIKGKLEEAEKRAEEAASKKVVQGIKDSLAREKARSAPVQRKALADRIRSLKIGKKGVAGSFIVPPQLFDLAVEVVATAVQAGESLASAIGKGIDRIKASDWYKKLSEEDRRKGEDEFTSAINDAARDDVKDERIRIPKDAIREAVAAGADDINSLVAAVREGVLKEHPDATDRQIRDAITGYGKQASLSRDAISAEVRRLGRIGRTISRIEDAKSKGRSSSKAFRDKIDAEEKALRAELKEVLKSIPLTPEQQAEVDSGRLQASKTRIEGRIAELEKRIKEGDFAKEPKREPIQDDELTALKARRLHLQEQYDKEFYKEKLRNRTFGEKSKDALWEAWGLTRALQATGELSFVLMQGGVQTISNLWHNPTAVGRAFQTMWSAMKSEKRSEQWLGAIKSQPWYPQAKEAKLAITEPHAQLSAREEMFVSEWTRGIWNIASHIVALPALAAGKDTYTRAAKRISQANPFRALERGAAAYLDTLRIERFLDGMEMLETKKAEGKEVTKQDYRDVADMVNTLTGRASLGAGETVATGLTKIFFSPRLWASSFKTFTPYGIYHFGKMTPTARKMAVQDMGRFVGTTMAFVAMAAAYLNDDDDEETGVEFDPRSSDFLKIKIGDTRIDPWGGKIQQVVLFSRLTAWAFGQDAYKTGKGEVLPLGVRGKSNTAFDTVMEMVTNKLAPSASMLHELASTHPAKDGTLKDKYGNEFILSEEAKERFLPIYTRTVQELAEDDMGALVGPLMVYAFLGGGVQSYGKKEKAK